VCNDIINIIINENNININVMILMYVCESNIIININENVCVWKY